MIRRRRLAAILVCALLAGAPLAQAWADDEDGEAAEAALARGDARPVHELLQQVRSKFAGSVLKVELEHEDEGERALGVRGEAADAPRRCARARVRCGEPRADRARGRYRENEDDD